MPRGLYKFIWPFVRLLDAEQAHSLALFALKSSLVPVPKPFNPPELGVSLWGMTFPNPIGLAAGFDKNAEVFEKMLDQGFGFVEVGSVTPRPQAGNPRPRLFRLEKDRAVINQMGFNNQGHAMVASRINARKPDGGIVGVNLGKNKDSSDAAADYEAGATIFSPLADFLVINISSPNTPGLRALQGQEPLKELLARTIAARDSVASSGGHTPILLKIAPDLTDEDKSDIAEVSIDAGVDGLIISNTTIERPDTLTDPYRVEGGGLSGRPLFEMSTRVLSEMYVATDGKIPLVGVGGVEDGRGAYEKIINGASLVELYSAMVFEGPDVVETIKRELVDCLKSDGFESVVDAIGSRHR